LEACSQIALWESERAGWSGAFESSVCPATECGDKVDGSIVQGRKEGRGADNGIVMREAYQGVPVLSTNWFLVASCFLVFLRCNFDAKMVHSSSTSTGGVSGCTHFSFDERCHIVLEIRGNSAFLSIG